MRARHRTASCHPISPAKPPAVGAALGRAPADMREQMAVQIMSRLSGKPQSHFRVARSIAPGLYYDWVDPDTGAHGQCRVNADGSWHTKPQCSNPVVLLYIPHKPSPIDPVDHAALRLLAQIRSTNANGSNDGR